MKGVCDRSAGRARPHCATVAIAVACVAIGLATCAARAAERPGPTSGATGEQVRRRDNGWFAPRIPPVPSPELAPVVTRAFLIPIHGAISSTLYKTLKRKVLRCRAGGAEIVVFDMDTPGGEVGVMKDIVELIMEDMPGIYTVAYVHPEAISAGAVISLACDEIVMAPGSKIGDAMPIMIVGGQLAPLPKAERGKIESYMRADIRRIAKARGYPEALCEAMITLTTRIWLIRNSRTQELRTVDPAEKNWAARVANTPAQAGRQGSPPTTDWDYIDTLDNDEELVTLLAGEARDCGLIDHILPDLAAVKKHYGIGGDIIELADSWSESLVGWLTSPAVAGLLMMVGVVGIYMEMRTPGFGAPGIIGAACFIILFGSKYMVGLADWWEIGLFVVGVVLIALEVFVIPGFGVAGISGGLCCVTAVLMMLVANPPGKMPIPASGLEWRFFNESVMYLSLAFIMSVVIACLLGRYATSLPLANRLILAPVTGVGGQPVVSDSPVRSINVGDVGLVESACRPVGKVMFGDELLDAASEGEVIPAGRTVRVLRRDGNRMIVEAVEEA